jgi:hypothetical protein
MFRVRVDIRRSRELSIGCDPDPISVHEQRPGPADLDFL